MRHDTYIWQHDGWPRMRYDYAAIATRLAAVRCHVGFLAGRLSALGFDVSQRATLNAVTADIATSAAIEGVHLDDSEVRSSLARHLGLPTAGLPVASHYVEGIVDVMLDATGHCREPLTRQRLFGWHAALFPTGWSGAWQIKVGAWRDDEMEVVSGAMGKERVHYQAPPPQRVDNEMEAFITWVNTPQSCDAIIAAAVAHLWFVTIHPFDDGNGRVARTLTDMLLSRDDTLPQRYYSLSAELLRHRTEYYAKLEQAQHGRLDITPWVAWFVEAVGAAVDCAAATVEAVMAKAAFWKRHSTTPLNERQRKLLNRLLDGFDGKLTTSKWAKIAHCSQDTALRDITALMAAGILLRSADSGRSTAYELCTQ